MTSFLCTRRGFRVAALAGLLVLGGGSSEAQPAVRQVLLLQSFARGNLTLDYFTGHFRVDLDQRIGTPVNVVQVVIGPDGFVGASEQAVLDYIRAHFAGRSAPDLIVTVAGPAAVFARTHRQQLFPDTPLLLAAVDQKHLSNAPLGENETAVPVVNDYPGFIDGILQLRPQTRQVLMVMGSGQLSQFWRRELEAEFRRFHDRLTFIWSNDLSLPEILRRCASLSRADAIIYFNFGTDAAGAPYADERVLAELHAVANAPLFGVQSVYLGYGIVGGTLMSMDDLSRTTADVAVRLLNGAPPGSVRVPAQRPGQPTFDWRELRKWGIAESRLPPGSVVRFQHPTLWQEYKIAVLSAIGALAIQLFLIVGLLYERRKRQQAEIESRTNLALAADANRRETMSAMTGSIAHELGQPLSSIMYNAQALQMMVAANQATAETTEEILADIQAQGLRATQIVDHHRTMLRSRQLDKKPLDLHAIINESLTLVAYDIRARQVRSSVHLSSATCVVTGDQVLLQQVLVNLLINAMDAMAATPPARRYVTIRTEVRAAEVDVSVRDSGTGVPAEIVSKLFTPFVSTKEHGLGIGLTIVRTIVQAHGGRIAARNSPEGGATFTVTLPRSDVSGVPAGRPPAA